MKFIGFAFVLSITVSGNVFAKRNVLDALTSEKTWLNTSKALTSDDLDRRIILVDFWTFCCINCMHVIPELHVLEKEFKEDLTVIGVHSAKFENEKDTQDIRNAILRYNIEHPVVNDADFKIWNAFGVRAWPTLLLIDPNGDVVGNYAGEGHTEEIRKDILKIKDKFKGMYASKSLPLSLEKTKKSDTQISFPGKFAFDPISSTLFLSDSGHSQIVALNLNTKNVLARIGIRNGSQLIDGDFQTASFNHPQGLLFYNEKLYVADTLNHALREVDFAGKKVVTLAGKGNQGFDRTFKEKDAKEVLLASPWDIAIFDHKLTIAMAGTHQLWSYDFTTKRIKIIAGSGRESIDDGSYPYNSLSQPSGLSSIGDNIYFVDSETSSLRVIKNGKIETLIGKGLFDFGMSDGTKSKARMQHPLGLFAEKNEVFIADSYNHAIRVYDIAQKKLATLFGKGKAGSDVGAFEIALLNEPSGVFINKDELWIADTNNHRVLKANLKSRIVEEVVLVETPGEKKPTKFPGFLPNRKDLPDAVLGLNSSGAIDLGSGWKLNEEAPTTLKVYKFENRKWTQLLSYKRVDLERETFDLKMKTPGKYMIAGTIYYCEKVKNSQCLIRSIVQNIEVNKGKSAIWKLKIPI